MAVREQTRQLVAQFLAQLVIEVGERLIQQDEVGILHERAGDRRALLLSARQLRGLALQHRCQAQQLGDRLDAALDLVVADSADPQRRRDVLIDREVWVVDELLIDHGDVALLHLRPGHVLAAEPDLASARFVEPGHQLHERRLAGQRGA
jgi:hypothetical protein